MPLINPRCQPQPLPLGDGRFVLLIDDFFTDPESLRQLAAAHAAKFAMAAPATFPGLQLGVQPALQAELDDFVRLQVRGLLGARRIVDSISWWGLATLPPEALRPRQWFCHTDHNHHDPARHLVIASLAYLFHDVELGGTSFYRPRLPRAELQQMLLDCQALAPAEFAARWDVQPGYMQGSTRAFEQVLTVAPRWNRMLFYDGDIFHSADLARPERLSADPLRGRLTVNSFFSCTRSAR